MENGRLSLGEIRNLPQRHTCKKYEDSDTALAIMQDYIGYGCPDGPLTDEWMKTEVVKCMSQMMEAITRCDKCWIIFKHNGLK